MQRPGFFTSSYYIKEEKRYEYAGTLSYLIFVELFWPKGSSYFGESAFVSFFR